jgi:hypothetical protein
MFVFDPPTGWKDAQTRSERDNRFLAVAYFNPIGEDACRLSTLYFWKRETGKASMLSRLALPFLQMGINNEIRIDIGLVEELIAKEKEGISNDKDLKRFKDAVHHKQARCLTVDRKPLRSRIQDPGSVRLSFNVRDLERRKGLAPPPEQQVPAAGDAKVPNPLRVPARRDEVAIPVEREQVDRRPSGLPALPTGHLEHTRPRNADPEAGEPCHRAVEHVTGEPTRLAVMRLSHHPAHGTARRVAGERGLTSGGRVDCSSHRLRQGAGRHPEGPSRI